MISKRAKAKPSKDGGAKLKGLRPVLALAGKRQPAASKIHLHVV